MARSVNHSIWFVDDEPDVCAAVSQGLGQEGYDVTCFEDAETCLKRIRKDPLDLLMTDFSLPGMDGLALMQQARNMIRSLPVLIITGYGDIPLAVKATKAGAVGFIEKPLDLEVVLSEIQSILRGAHPAATPEDRLTKSEMRVLRLIMDGKTNKDIARQLYRSVRTVEDHRSHIMRKLGMHNLLDLIKVATSMGYGSGSFT